MSFIVLRGSASQWGGELTGAAPWQLPGRAGGGAGARGGWWGGGIKPSALWLLFFCALMKVLKTESLRIVFARFVFGHSLAADLPLADESPKLVKEGACFQLLDSESN